METISTVKPELKPTPEMVAKAKQIAEQNSKAEKPIQPLAPKILKIAFDRIDKERKLQAQADKRNKESKEKIDLLEAMLKDNPAKLDRLDREQEKLDVLLKARANLISEMKDYNQKVNAQRSRVERFMDSRTRRVLDAIRDAM